MDDSDQISEMNSTLRHWLKLDTTPPQDTDLRFVDILTRASRIYFETYLRPLLVMNGHFSEISIELECKDGTQLGVFLNGDATLLEGRLVKAHFCVFKNEQRQSFERELVAKRRESDEFRILVKSSPYAVFSADTNLLIHAWNPAAEQLFGYTEEEALGKRFDRLLIPAEDLEFVAADQLRVASGEVLRSEVVRRHKDGSRLDLERSVAAIYDETRDYSGFVAVFSDISGRKSSEVKIRTLLEEINHRSKNLLTIIQIIAQQTGRRYEGAEFTAVFSKRLASMASNQDILIRSDANQVDLETLARAQFAHLIEPDDAQVTISGPSVHFNETVSQAVGMAIFELATNAAKYGALSQETGSVTLTWAINDGPPPTIDISWVETDGPLVTAPTREGFGSQLIGPILEGATSGTTSCDFDPKGLRWSLNAPYDQLSQ